MSAVRGLLFPSSRRVTVDDRAIPAGRSCGATRPPPDEGGTDFGIGMDRGDGLLRAAEARASFNRRFWYEPGGWLYDVVDGEEGDDPSLRPNQVFALSLRFPVLDDGRWRPVLDGVADRLLTTVRAAHARPRASSEIFDAEPPHVARGCIAQAWSVAEALRAYLATEGG
ncbi:MAG: hypothetical protein HYR51_10105 [Candidatus Rokubacteria bacterium]|nr:hypothetical protein [Candidatus Rokubacteria bacterium]